VDQVLSMRILAVLFYNHFFGARYMGGPTARFGSRLESIVVVRMIWMPAACSGQARSQTS